VELCGNTPRTVLKITLMKIRDEKDTDKRNELLTKLVDSIAAADVPSMLNDFQAFDGNEIAREVSLRLLRRWAKLNGPAAAAWAKQLPSWPSNTEQSLAWTRQIGDDCLRDQAFAGQLFANGVREQL
jgi:hypothetical protein